MPTNQPNFRDMRIFLLFLSLLTMTKGKSPRPVIHKNKLPGKDKLLNIELLFFLLPALLIIATLSPGSVGASNQEKAKQADSPFLNFVVEEKIEKLNEQISNLFDQGKYEEALPVAESICILAQTEFGIHHNEYAKALNNHGWLLQAGGNYNQARKKFEQALSIQEVFWGTTNPELAPVLNNLASLLAYQGDYSSALPLLQRSLELQETAYGKEDIQIAGTLNNMAVILDSSGRPAEALPLLERALLISEKKGHNEGELASQITNLALLYESTGKFHEAETLLEKVRETRRKTAGTTHPDYAEILNNLAMVKAKQGAFADAHKLLTEAQEIYKAALGSRHPDVATTLNNLGRVELLMGEKSKAQEKFLTAAHIIDHHIFSVLPFLSFAEQRVFLNTRVPEEISLLLSHFREGEALQESYSLLMRWKGLLIESLRRQNILKLMSASGKQSAVVERLVNVRKELSSLHHHGQSGAARQAKSTIMQLTGEKESLERQLADSAEGRLACDPLQDLNAQSFAKLLSPDENLIDIYKFHKEDSPDDYVYGAIIVSPSLPLRYVELGNSKVIEDLLKAWRRIILAQGEGVEQWKALKSHLWDKIYGAGNRKSAAHIFLSPEASLARLPWHLFVDLDAEGSGQLLSEVDSARELALLKQLETQPSKISDSSVLLVGNIDFITPAAENIARTENDSINKLPQLPGTKQELAAIADLAIRKGYALKELTETKATREAVIAALPGVSYAHFATHGFFQAEGLFNNKRLQLANTKTGTEPKASRNPLLQSGLVLSAGTNGKSTAEASDILTAEDLVGLDLNHCCSFVLSACETGLGEGETGQGVLGLRSGIMAAGAQHVLLSLWKVPDEATKKLMICFYENLWLKKLPAAEALRQAQKTVKEEPYERFRAPVHWAAWVLVGKGWGLD